MVLMLERILARLFLSGMILAIPICVFCQVNTDEQNLPLRINHLSGPITLDGKIDEAGWNDATPFDLIMQSPNYGLPPSEKTKILVGFDDHYLYFGASLFDNEPDKIQNPSKKRDYMQGDTDWFGIILDTFNDKENGLVFYTTPSGLRFDGAIFNDAVPSSPESMPINTSWNTFWDVETMTDDRGWFAEIRIPFSSLRFQENDGKVTMGLILYRFIPRKNEVNIYPSIPPNWGPYSSWKCSRACEVSLEGIESRNPLYITPFGLGGYGQLHDLNEAETAYVRTDNPVRDIGLDIKYGLTSNLTMDLTINTDFAQVEADDVQVNLTRYSLYYPEKRLFFQERASVFDFSFGGPTNVFYSRQIGLYEEEIVPIYGGARLVGRLGGWDFGFMDMQTAAIDGVASENFGVLRMRKRIFNPYSYAGGIITTRLGRDGSYNVVYGLDTVARLSENDYLLFNWAQCLDNEQLPSSEFLDQSRFRIGLDRRTNKGWGGMVSVGRRGPDYEPGMGFELLENYLVFHQQTQYGWLPGPESPLQAHNISHNTRLIYRNEDSGLMTLKLEPAWEFTTKSGWFGRIAPSYNRESLTEIFELSDDRTVPIGEYDFWSLQTICLTPSGKRLNTMFIGEAGEFYDGRRLSLSVTPNWAVINNLSLSGFYQYNRVVFPERDENFTAHIARLKLEATMSTALTTSAFIQYNSAASIVIANFRLRFNPREGNDFYLVINENFFTSRTDETPFLPPYDSRAVMVKYSHTFVF